MDQKATIERLQAAMNDLQTQLAFQEDTIQTLSDIVHGQQQQLDQLVNREQETLSQLQQLLEEQGQQPANERPPHY